MSPRADSSGRSNERKAHERFRTITLTLAGLSLENRKLFGQKQGCEDIAALYNEGKVADARIRLLQQVDEMFGVTLPSRSHYKYGVVLTTLDHELDL